MLKVVLYSHKLPQARIQTCMRAFEHARMQRGRVRGEPWAWVLGLQ